MRNYKTSKANRATYRYYDIEGKLRCELVPGQDGVTGNPKDPAHG